MLETAYILSNPIGFRSDRMTVEFNGFSILRKQKHHLSLY
jgi:hypothetical protein